MREVLLKFFPHTNSGMFFSLKENWKVGNTVKADIQATREYREIESAVNPLARASIVSRRKLMGIKEKIVDILIPTQPIIRGFLESNDKESYEKKNNMTPEEIKYA